jgi:hypothetical protein
LDDVRGGVEGERGELVIFRASNAGVCAVAGWVSERAATVRRALARVGTGIVLRNAHFGRAEQSAHTNQYPAPSFLHFE